MGSLRGIQPITRYGWERGRPIDRFYIEEFLGKHSADIRGHVLEVRDGGYTRRFGSVVERSDVLDIDPANKEATIVSDLAGAESIPTGTIDCFILTQTLQYIREIDAAIGHVQRILRPGGTLLATMPTIGRMDDPDSEYWRLTPASCAALFGKHFTNGTLEIQAFGNVLTAVAFLKGLACEDLRRTELEYVDPHFPMILCIRARK